MGAHSQIRADGGGDGEQFLFGDGGRQNRGSRGQMRRDGCRFASDPHDCERLMKTLRPVTKKLLMVKLSPNVTDIAEIARAAAGRRLVDAIIEPSSTRHHVAQVLEYLHTKRELRPAKKHGLMPL